MEQTKIHRSIVRLNDLDLFFMDTQTDGPVILCLHGRWGRAETWTGFMRHYGSQYRVIAPDQRGHGLSGKPVCKYTAEEMAEDARNLLYALGINSYILVGHSMGARVAGVFAAAYPDRVRALALMDKSAARFGPPNTLTLEQIPDEDPLTKDWPTPFESRKDALDFLRTNQESELSVQYFMSSLAETVEGWRMLFSPRAMAANIAFEEDWFNLLPQIRCPVLLLRAKGGEAVPDADFERMKSLLPDCVAREASQRDHNVHLSDPKEFYGYFDELLARLCPG